MIVFQKNINQPTEELVAEVLKHLLERPENKELIDSYRQLRRQMKAAEAKKRVDEFVNEVKATDDYKKALAAELKKDERRKNKRVPDGDLERVKWYISQKKTSLPAIIPTITHFAESKDRWGRKGLWRVQQYGYLSGFAVVDGDHVPDVEERINEWLQREDFNDLGIVCIFITPSGEGVKVLFKSREEWGNLQDNAYTMAEKLGILDYCDSQTKNSDHAHFIPKAEDVKYMDWETLFNYVNPAFEARFGEAYRRGESDPTLPRWQELERLRSEARKGTASPASTQSPSAAQPAGTQPTALTERQQAIVKAFDARYGETIAEGHRHETWLGETAPWLLLLTDNNAQEALTIGREISYVKNWSDKSPGELENCIATVSQKPLLRRRPKALQELLDKAGIKDDAPAVVSSESDPLSALPFDRWCDQIEGLFDEYPGMREALEPHERPLWPWLLFVTGGMMGTDMDLCYYYFYADPTERQRLNYIIWGVGDPTSGKHALQRLAELLLAPTIAEGELADASTNDWKSTSDVKATNKDGVERPPLYNRYFGGSRASNSEFIRSMVYSKEVVDGEEMGRHMVTVDPEKDLTIGKSGSWANRESMLLRSFHGEYDSQHYSNKQSVSARFKVFWNCFETFTPPTLTLLVNERSVNSGLDTRTATLPTGKMSFSMMELPSEEEKKKIAEYNETLRQIAYKLDQRRGELPIWKLVEHVHQWCDERRAIAEFNNDPADWLLIKRVPHWGVRVSAPFIDLKHEQERLETGTYTIDAQDLALCDLVLDIQYRTQHYWYYELHRQYYENQLHETARQRRRTTRFQECFRRLPHDRAFTTEEFAQTFGYANTHSGQKTLDRLIDDKAIKRTMRGHYKTLVAELPTW